MRYRTPNKIIRKKYARLIIKKDLGMVMTPNGKQRRMCEVLCRCGNTKVVRLDGLKDGTTKSCGCIMDEYLATGNSRRKHDDSRGHFYRRWASMKARAIRKSLWYQQNENCYTKNNIGICPEWEDYEKFKRDMYKTYLRHVHEHTERDTTIDRIDSSGNYSKKNCRWATYKQQNNNKTNNVKRK